MKKVKLLSALFASAAVLFVAGCKNDEDPTTVTVSTSTITDISTTTATASSSVVIDGNEALTDRGFCWSENHSPTTAGSKVSAGSGAGPFSASLTGLLNSTTYFVRAYVINDGATFYGEEVSFSTSEPIELIVNGDFSAPNDESVTSVNLTTPWKTDETNADWIGRSKDADWDPTNYVVWVSDWSKSIYQVVGKVPAVKTDYKIAFDANWIWTYWGDYMPVTTVVFSAYSGSDATTRTVIGTVELPEPAAFPGWGNNWGPRNATFTLTADQAAQFAGKNLVIEFDVLPYIGDYNDQDVWYDFDNISVKQL